MFARVREGALDAGDSLVSGACFFPSLMLSEILELQGGGGNDG